MIKLEDVTANVLEEVKRAQAQWGESFDKKNTLNDWATYINIYVGKAVSMGNTPAIVERNLRKAAGLCLSALFYHLNGGCAPRHYEEQQRPASLPEIEVA